MKIGTTVAIAMMAAAAIAAIYWQWPAHRQSQSPSVASVPAVPQPSAPTSFESPAGPPLAAAPSPADMTRLTIQSLLSDDAAVREHAIAQLLPALVRQDAVAAARVADLFVDSPLRPKILSAVARGWTDQNRLHALDWAQSLPDTSEREAVLVEILSRISQSDPAEAVRLRQQMAQDPIDDAELTNLAQRWAESDLSAVLGWTDSLPPGAQRDQLIARTAFIQSQSSPAQAAQLVLERIPRSEAQTEALISVVHQWAERDFDAASAWVARIPERLMRERAEEELEAAKRAQR